MEWSDQSVERGMMHFYVHCNGDFIHLVGLKNLPEEIEGAWHPGDHHERVEGRNRKRGH